MGRKGLSLEEKRKRMMDFFYETEGVFQLKEVEKICSKEKGITSMSIKDVLQSLVDDGMVHAERVGTSNYYWAFPSEGVHIRKRKRKDLSDEIGTYKEKRAALEKGLKDVTKGREDTPERTETLEELAKAKTEKQRLEDELQMHKDYDPELIQEKENHTKVAIEAANRWTDNIFCIKSFCQKRFNMDPKTLDKHFGIPEDFDYLE